MLQDKFTGLRDQLNEFGGFVVGLVRNQQQQRGAHSYRNAFDVPRKSLLDQVVRMRSNFLQSGLSHTKLLDDDYVHSMPVAQMGNYQEYLKRMTPPLREIESVPVRQHMFGKPIIDGKRKTNISQFFFPRLVAFFSINPKVLFRCEILQKIYPNLFDTLRYVQ